MEYVITFKNTNFAIKAEHCLLNRAVHATVMPLPSEICAGCGICLRVPEIEIKVVLLALSDEKIDEITLYKRVKTGNKFVYSEVNKADI